MAYNLRGLFNPKAILIEWQKWYFLSHNWRIRGFIAFPKVNAVALLEFELASYDVAV